MKKIELEVLKMVKGLSLPDSMGNKGIDELNYELDAFIETLPGKTYELTKNLIVRDYDFLLKKLNDMYLILNRIYAEDAKQSNVKLVELIKTDTKKSEIDIYLESFISELSTLSIDIQLAQHKSHEKRQENDTPKRDTLTRLNILAVDDDPVILNTLKKVLDNDKYKFSGAVSGKVALKYLETHILPDLIILDIDMPEMNGYELTKNIKDKGYGIESGKLELSLIDYSFPELLDNINSMFQFSAHKKNIDFRFQTDGEIPSCLHGDDVRLRQILVNLCGNAVKFTEEGFVCLKIKANDESIIFQIEDTGAGISEEALKTIFNPFSQADDGKNRNIKGTGLGLSICKQLTEMMGGNITVDSAYGQGTIFTVTIPKIIGNEYLIKQRESAPKKFYAPTAQILVVDDNEINLSVAKGFLELYGIKVDTVLSGFEAIEAVKEKDYDIVFVDHMMPEMDGVETTKKIRGLGGKFKRLRIIALTANAVSGAKEMFLSNGFDDFISKPIEISRLSEILMKWIPQDKITTDYISPVVNEPYSEEKSEFIQRLEKIDAVNVDKGMKRFSNMQDMYHETLRLLYERIESECEKMKAFLADDKLNDFAIIVHGMKSSLQTVGVTDLSNLAYELEMAAKTGDKEFCDSQFPIFLTQMIDLHGQLSDIFLNEERKVANAKGSLKFLNENIQTAIAAANDLDTDLGIETITQLLNYDFAEIVELRLKNALDSLKGYDFDRAALVLNIISGLCKV